LRNDTPLEKRVLPHARVIKAASDRLEQPQQQTEMSFLREIWLDLYNTGSAARCAEETIVLSTPGKAENSHSMTHPRQRAGDTSAANVTAHVGREGSEPAENQN
jgi:hypothetical protein